MRFAQWRNRYPLQVAGRASGGRNKFEVEVGRQTRGGLDTRGGRRSSFLSSPGIKTGKNEFVRTHCKIKYSAG